MNSTHLIEIEEKADYVKALHAFRGIRDKRRVLPGNRMVVTDAHLAALDNGIPGGIQYRVISKMEDGTTK